MASGTHILLITGSTRSGSTNTAALRTAVEVAPDGVSTRLHDGLAELPAFNPDDDRDPLPASVADLRDRLAAADAVLVCTPEYAGALPGSFKNLLDWAVGGTGFNGKPTAWINAAAAGRGAQAHASLAVVLGYLDAAVVEEACRDLPVGRDTIGPDGTITDPAVRAGIAEVLTALHRAASGG